MHAVEIYGMVVKWSSWSKTTHPMLRTAHISPMPTIFTFWFNQLITVMNSRVVHAYTRTERSNKQLIASVQLLSHQSQPLHALYEML